MATIIDNTGHQTLHTVAGVIWTKTAHSSYTNYRSADDRFFVGQSPNKFWHISVRNAEGEFDTRTRRREVFAKADEALAFAATLTEEVAA